MGQYDFIGTPGDSGVILGGYYVDPKGRRFICMADHAEKGIWLDLPGADPDDPDGYWCGTREEFDAHGWTYTGEFDEVSKAL